VRTRILLILFLATTFLVKPYKGGAQVIASDSLVLVDMTSSIPALYKLWPKIYPVKTWPGITLSADGTRVTGITMVPSNPWHEIHTDIYGKLPTSTGNLSALTFLDISYTDIGDSLPASIGNLSSLVTLNLSYTAIHYLPPQIGNLTSLQYLYLVNLFLDKLPPETGDMSNLIELDIYGGSLSVRDTLPSHLGNLSNLQRLRIESRQLKGNIPATFGNLAKLKSLTLNCPFLTGSIPPQLGNLANLDTLILTCDSISGSIPAELGNLSSLRYLAIHRANISGALAPELGNMANLRSMIITNTQINGKIPATFGNLTYLNTLNLEHNQLDDSLQPALGQLGYCRYFVLRYNKIPGPIPPEFGNIGYKLRHYTYTNIPWGEFALDHNNLTGTIPAELGNLYVDGINLSFNQLTGPIPSNFDSLDGGYFYPGVALNNNRFNFAGIEQLVQAYQDRLLFSPQASVPLIRNGNALKLICGDTSSNIEYNWYYTSANYHIHNGYGQAYDSIAVTKPGRYFCQAVYRWPVNGFNAVGLISDTAYYDADSLIMPAKPATLTANYEYTDTLGWTHYYYDNNTPGNLKDDILLLSLYKNTDRPFGVDIGRIGDGHFSVKLVATAGAGSNTGIKLNNPMVTNGSGYYVMNRYWQVTPTEEPNDWVGVRFYYNNQDVADVNGSYPTHNLTADKLIFYKTVGGNPDPTTNLAGATKIISIMPGSYTGYSTNMWKFGKLTDSTYYAEYSVESFSGGGGGGTGNNFSLPVTLLNFTAARAKTDVNLNWQTAQEINAANYFVERSLNGFDFTGIGSVAAMGNSTIKQSYSYVDRNASALNTGTLYYRLKITDKDGSFSYSKIISLQPDGIDKALILYPNPAHTSAIVQFTAATAKKYTIAVTAADGKVLRRINIAASAGSNRVVIDVHDLPQATYLVNITGDKDSKTLTLVKQ